MQFTYILEYACQELLLLALYGIMIHDLAIHVISFRQKIH
jgi:hypothetical protein